MSTHRYTDEPGEIQEIPRAHPALPYVEDQSPGPHRNFAREYVLWIVNGRQGDPTDLPNHGLSYKYCYEIMDDVDEIVRGGGEDCICEDCRNGCDPDCQNPGCR